MPSGFHESLNIGPGESPAASDLAARELARSGRPAGYFWVPAQNLCSFMKGIKFHNLSIGLYIISKNSILSQ
jgi:hypothetical protein